MRVLGIDPGSRYLGYGLVDFRLRHATYVGHGVVKCGDGPLPLRLRFIHEALARVVAVHRPDAVAVEGVFTHKNARSALILGHARGVALLLAAQAGLEVFEYAPARVKKSVGAGGNDGKDAVARMVTHAAGADAARWSARTPTTRWRWRSATARCAAAVGAAARGGRKGRAADFVDRLKPAFVPAPGAAP